MRTSVIVASVALVALAILAPSDAGCLPNGGCLPNVVAKAKHYLGSKSSQEAESDESCSVNVVDLGGAKLKQTVQKSNSNFEKDYSQNECDEQTINTPDGQMMKKSSKSQSMEEDSSSSSYHATSQVTPDCGC